MTVRQCLNCGEEIQPGSRGKPRLYCDRKCKKSFNNRRNREGAAIVSLAKAWRAARNLPKGHPGKEVGQHALSEMSSVLDVFIVEDREANRPAPYLAAEWLLSDGKYIDRRLT